MPDVKPADARVLLDAGSSGRGWSWRDPFLRCMQKGAFANADNIMVDAAPALAKGSLVHVGLAHWGARRQAQENNWDPDQYHPPRDAIALVAGKNGWTAHESLAAETVDAYIEDRPFAQNRILAVEQRMVRWVTTQGFVKPPPDAEHRLGLLKSAAGRLALSTCGEPYLDTARADLILGDSAGRIYIVDYKTASVYNGRSKQDGYTLSGQFLGMARYGQHVWGDRFGGILIAMLPFDPPRSGPRWPVIHPDPAPWALRNYIATVIEQESRLAAAATAVAEAMFDSDLAKAAAYLVGPGVHMWPMALSEQVCVGRYGACPFLLRCRWGPSEGWGLAPTDGVD
jgi:hypothetical protein